MVRRIELTLGRVLAILTVVSSAGLLIFPAAFAVSATAHLLGFGTRVVVHVNRRLDGDLALPMGYYEGRDGRRHAAVILGRADPGQTVRGIRSPISLWGEAVVYRSDAGAVGTLVASLVMMSLLGVGLWGGAWMWRDERFVTPSSGRHPISSDDEDDMPPTLDLSVPDTGAD